MSSTSKTPPNGEEKKKSKLDRIFELQADRKRLKEENKSLRKQLDAHQQGTASPNRKRAAKSSEEEKLLAAMNALKRVTVKQEQNLCTLRSKAEERRQELAEKDLKIDALKKEVSKLKRSLKAKHKTAPSSSTISDDIDSDLRTKMEELQLNSTEQANRNKELTEQLKESEERVKSLQKQLDSARGLIKGSPSATSILSSGDMSMSEMDVAKLRKDLANKIERIVLLEFDLEMCKDALHELRMTRSSSAASYPEAQNYEAADDDGSFYDSYSDLSDSDDDEDEQEDFAGGDDGWR